MRTTKVLSGVLAAVCLMAFAAPSANAAGIGPGAGATFTGTNIGSHVFTTNNNTLRVTCTGANIVAGTGVVNATPVDTHGHPTTARFRIAYSGCTAVLAGTPVAASVAVGCDWTATISTFNTISGASTGFVTTPCATVVTIGGGACTVTVPATPSVSGTGQNITAAGTSSPANGAPAGLILNANGGGSSLTSTCPGVAPPWTYSGSNRITGIWAVD